MSESVVRKLPSLKRLTLAVFLTKFRLPSIYGRFLVSLFSLFQPVKGGRPTDNRSCLWYLDSSATDIRLEPRDSCCTRCTDCRSGRCQVDLFHSKLHLRHYPESQAASMGASKVQDDSARRNSASAPRQLRQLAITSSTHATGHGPAGPTPVNN